jgi:hypothetical protein
METHIERFFPYLSDLFEFLGLPLRDEFALAADLLKTGNIVVTPSNRCWSIYPL